jgi:hypothetical protein
MARADLNRTAFRLSGKTQFSRRQNACGYALAALRGLFMARIGHKNIQHTVPLYGALARSV